MNKSELIKKILLKHPNISDEQMGRIIDVVFNKITSSLKDKKRVEIRGFGSFSIRNRKAREARNPRTNEVIELADRSSIYFRASKKLNQMINND